MKFVPAHRPRIEVDLCSGHREDFREARSYGGYDFWSWIADNQRTVRGCPNCTYFEERDYYALYDVEMKVGDARFSWHVPFSLGKEWLPPKGDLVAVAHAGDGKEGAFLYGRPVDEDEKVLWPAKRVEKEIEALLGLFGENGKAAVGMVREASA